MIGHHKHILLIETHDTNALVSQERLFSPLFSLESKFIHQIRQKWIQIIIFILFVIGHHKHIFLIRIHDIVASVSPKKLFFPHFLLESKFIHQIRETMILIVISILFVIRHRKHDLLIRIHNIDALGF